MDNLIEKIRIVFDSFQKEISQTEEKFPGTMNLIELMNRHHLENEHSNVLAYLINPYENHKHPEYGNSFIKIVNSKLSELGQSQIPFLYDYPDEIKYVHREEQTYNNRRIDILIKTESSFIIIENKIKAKDQPEQMIDYINDIEGKDDEGDKGREIFCIYLTPTDRNISEESLTDKEKKYIQGYVNITYLDILYWLQSLQTRDDEIVLRAALTQYKDVLEGLTKKRVTFDKKKILTGKFIDYFFSNSSSYDYSSLMYLLKDFRTSSDFPDKRLLVEETLPIIIYIKFLIALMKKLLHSEDIQIKNELETPLKGEDFNFFCGNSFYDSENEWLLEVKKQQKEFGIIWRSPNPDVMIYFMFANAGRTSAYKGYKFLKPAKHDNFIGNPQYSNDYMTYEKMDFINKKLLLVYDEDKNLLEKTAENFFIKQIKAMNDKWF